MGCHFLLQHMKVKSEREVARSCPTLSDPWTTAHQAPPSMGFSRQEYWSGVPLPSPSKRLALIYYFYECSFPVVLQVLCHGALSSLRTRPSQNRRYRQEIPMDIQKDKTQAKESRVGHFCRKTLGSRAWILISALSYICHIYISSSFFS